MTQNLLIYGYFGWYNAGDDAIGYGILKELSNRNLSINITLTSNDPYFENYVKKIIPGIKIATIKFQFLSLFKTLLKSEKFIIAGGTHFTDEDRLNFRRMKIFIYFYILTLFANIIQKPPLLLGHGIGPVTKPWNKFLLKRILKNSNFILVRDKDSYDVVASLGFRKKCILGFDCSVPLIQDFHEYRESKNNLIGLSILPAYEIYSGKPTLDIQVISSLCESFHKVFQEYPFLHITIFSFRGGSRHSDEAIVSELNNLLRMYSRRIMIVNYHGDIVEFISKMKECSMFIGMRYHSSLFAFLLAKPLIIIDYMGKCQSLAKDIRQDSDYVLSLNEILLNPNGNLLYSRLHNMIENKDLGYSKTTLDVAIEQQKVMFSKMDEYLS